MENEIQTILKNCPIYDADNFKFEYNEDSIKMDFGKNITPTTVEQITSVTLPVELLLLFIQSLIELGISYEEEYGVDLEIVSDYVEDGECEDE